MWLDSAIAAGGGAMLRFKKVGWKEGEGGPRPGVEKEQMLPQDQQTEHFFRTSSGSTQQLLW